MSLDHADCCRHRPDSGLHDGAQGHLRRPGQDATGPGRSSPNRSAIWPSRPSGPGPALVGFGREFFLFILSATGWPSCPSGDRSWSGAVTFNSNWPWRSRFVLVHYNSIRAVVQRVYLKPTPRRTGRGSHRSTSLRRSPAIHDDLPIFGNIFSGVLHDSVIVTLIRPYLPGSAWALEPFDDCSSGRQVHLSACLTNHVLGMGHEHRSIRRRAARGGSPTSSQQFSKGREYGSRHSRSSYASQGLAVEGLGRRWAHRPSSG